MDRLLLLMFQVVYIVLSALLIARSIECFKKEMYFMFSGNLMAAIFIIFKLAESIFEW